MRALTVAAGSGGGGGVVGARHMQPRNPLPSWLVGSGVAAPCKDSTYRRALVGRSVACSSLPRAVVACANSGWGC
jgi:hypothetical protein